MNDRPVASEGQRGECPQSENFAPPPKKKGKYKPAQCVENASYRRLCNTVFNCTRLSEIDGRFKEPDLQVISAVNNE